MCEPASHASKLSIPIPTIAWRQPSHLSPRHKRRAQKQEIGCIKRWARVINQQACGWHVKAWHVSWWILYRFNKDSTHAQRWPSKVIVEERLFWKNQIWKKKQPFFHSCRTEMKAIPVWRHIRLLQAADIFPGSWSPRLAYSISAVSKGTFPFFWGSSSPLCHYLAL